MSCEVAPLAPTVPGEEEQGAEVEKVAVNSGLKAWSVLSTFTLKLWCVFWTSSFVYCFGSYIPLAILYLYFHVFSRYMFHVSHN